VLFGRRNGEGRIRNIVVGVGVGAIAKVAGIVIVEQVVVAWIALGVNFARQAGQVLEDGENARCIRVRAVAVGAAAGNRAASKAPSAVTVFGAPVFGAGLRIGIFDLVDDSGVRSASEHFYTFRRFRGVAMGIAEEESITKTQHDAVGSGAAHYWLVVVIAHGVGVGQIVQVWRIAFLHVVKAHGGGTFTSGAIIEIDGQGLSVTQKRAWHF
jgi:hypothetical protein